MPVTTPVTKSNGDAGAAAAAAAGEAASFGTARSVEVVVETVCADFDEGDKSAVFSVAEVLDGAVASLAPARNFFDTWPVDAASGCLVFGLGALA
jgi:hypothetical protein